MRRLLIISIWFTRILAPIAALVSAWNCSLAWNNQSWFLVAFNFIFIIVNIWNADTIWKIRLPRRS